MCDVNTLPATIIMGLILFAISVTAQSNDLKKFTDYRCISALRSVFLYGYTLL